MLSGTYLDSEAADRLNALKDAFAKHSDYVDQESGATVISAPFRSMVLPNLVQESVRLEEIRSLILSSTEFFHKSNDLYEFFQSNDLKHSAHAQIQKLISQLFSPAWISLMSHLTGIKLSATVDISCQKYPPGGYLLCHDDDMGEDEDSRRIAFILYLVEPDWNAQQDGGHLQLYTTDEKGHPKDIIKSILPKWNQLTFFEVTSTSYHQVQEVLGNRDRLSISGWFHGPRLSNPKALSQAAFSSCPTASLETWINPTYLSGAPQIQNAFMDQSYIILKDFLEPGMYTALVQEQEQWEWTRVGAANVKSHESLSRSSPLMSQLISLFGSESFARFLESLTGMESLQSKSLHAQQFQKGHYTLLHDHNLEETGLDFLFSFSSVPTEEWDESWGGALHYLADKETLLSRFPSQNELMLVYRDEGVLRFLKYVNSQCPSRRRDIWGLVVESEEGGESLNETDADTMMR